MLLCISHRGHAGDLTTKCFAKETERFVLCGLFDGQNGIESAEFASHFLKTYLVHNLKKLDLSTGGHDEEGKIKKLLSNAFASCQQHMLISDKRHSFVKTSTTACVVLRVRQILYTAHCGDTMVHVVHEDNSSTPITDAHTLRNTLEKINIIETGGWYSNGIICDKTHLTRGLGNLWQIRSLKWHKSNNLKHYDQSMQDWDLSRLSELLKEAPPAWCIDCRPDVRTTHLGTSDAFVTLQTVGMQRALQDDTSFLRSDAPERAISKRIKEAQSLPNVSNLAIIAIDCDREVGPEKHIGQKICDENLETEDGRLPTVQRGEQAS